MRTDQELYKIAIMSEMAVQDKYNRKKDIGILNFYKNDYIYKKNVVNRMGFYIGFILFLVFRVMHMLFVENTLLDYQQITSELKYYGFFMVMLLVLITIAGTYLYSCDYDQAAKRNKRYLMLLNELESQNKVETDDKQQLLY